jgi:hypothetical protein
MSRRCLEKRSSRQTTVKKLTDIHSSPPTTDTMDIMLDEDDLPSHPKETKRKWMQRHLSRKELRQPMQWRYLRPSTCICSTAPATRRTCPLTMMVLQYNCNSTAVSMVAALEAYIERGAEVACLQEPHAGRKHTINYPSFQIRWPECEKQDMRVALAIRNDALDRYVFEERTDLVDVADKTNKHLQQGQSTRRGVHN